MGRVLHDGVPELAGSPLALVNTRLEAGGTLALGEPERDSLLYVFDGSGSLSSAGDSALAAGSAALVLAGEQAALEAGAGGLGAILVTVGPDAARRGTTTSTTRSSGSRTARDGCTSATRWRSSAPVPRSGCARARCTSSRTRAPTGS
jgi:hypothetical protein